MQGRNRPRRGGPGCLDSGLADSRCTPQPHSTAASGLAPTRTTVAQTLCVCERKPCCQKEKLASNPQILRKRLELESCRNRLEINWFRAQLLPGQARKPLAYRRFQAALRPVLLRQQRSQVQPPACLPPQALETVTPQSSDSLHRLGARPLAHPSQPPRHSLRPRQRPARAQRSNPLRHAAGRVRASPVATMGRSTSSAAPSLPAACLHHKPFERLPRQNSVADCEIVDIAGVGHTQALRTGPFPRPWIATRRANRHREQPDAKVQQPRLQTRLKVGKVAAQ